MALPGWYPDPDGTPDRFRFFDGQDWSDRTLGGHRPAAIAPVAAVTQLLRDRARHLARLAGAVALLAVAMIAGLAVLASGIGPAVVADTASLSSWDDSHPLPRLSRAGTELPHRHRMPCPFAAGNAAPGQPGDGRVHGGGLSFAAVEGYPAAQGDTRFSWLDDVRSQTQRTEPHWISIFAVGSVHRSHRGFRTAREAAESSLECTITQGWYQRFSGRTDLQNRQITVGGRRGWLIVSEIRVDLPDVAVAGDQLTFVVLDTGRPGQLAVWCGMVPLGDHARLRLNADALADLRVG